MHNTSALLADVTSVWDSLSRPDARMACFSSAAPRYDDRLLATYQVRKIDGCQTINGGEVQKIDLQVIYRV